jgi:hypothetical protein
LTRPVTHSVCLGHRKVNSLGSVASATGGCNRAWRSHKLTNKGSSSIVRNFGNFHSEVNGLRKSHSRSLSSAGRQGRWNRLNRPMVSSG